MKKLGRFLVIIVLFALIVYFLGPKPDSAILSKDLPSLSSSIAGIQQYVGENDRGIEIKPDNESRIIWANDSIKERTEYCLLYLHGFSASWYEGYPANVEFAKYFGFNAYFPRLASHGIATDNPLVDMTPDRLWESAKKALMVARGLGKKVIIMSTSTGGTLSLKLAADFPEYVDALILYSPNIRINNSAAFLLSKPWGLQLGRKINGGDFRVVDQDFGEKYCKYWDCQYKIEALVYLQQLVDETMTKETFKNVSAPVFLGYYYKDENNQDEIVKVNAMLKMFEQLGTSKQGKIKIAFPEAGNHVIASELKSNSYQKVISETIKFGEDVLDLTPLN